MWARCCRHREPQDGFTSAGTWAARRRACIIKAAADCTCRPVVPSTEIKGAFYHVACINASKYAASMSDVFHVHSTVLLERFCFCRCLTWDTLDCLKKKKKARLLHCPLFLIILIIIIISIYIVLYHLDNYNGVSLSSYKTVDLIHRLINGSMFYFNWCWQFW